MSQIIILKAFDIIICCVLTCMRLIYYGTFAAFFDLEYSRYSRQFHSGIIHYLLQLSIVWVVSDLKLLHLDLKLWRHNYVEICLL